MIDIPKGSEALKKGEKVNVWMLLGAGSKEKECDRFQMKIGEQVHGSKVQSF